RGALRVWCQSAQVPKRACLDFLRVLRAIVRSTNGQWDMLSVLDVADRQGLRALLDRGRVRTLFEGTIPTVDAFMSRQRYIENAALCRAIARQIHESAPLGPSSPRLEA